MAAALRPDEEKLYEGQPKGFPFGQFELEDVMLPEGDDMGVPSEDEEDEEEDIETESGFENILSEFCAGVEGWRVLFLCVCGGGAG